MAFYDYLETIRTTHLSYNPSAWVFMDAATMLFEVGVLLACQRSACVSVFLLCCLRVCASSRDSLPPSRCVLVRARATGSL